MATSFLGHQQQHPYPPAASHRGDVSDRDIFQSRDARARAVSEHPPTTAEQRRDCGNFDAQHARSEVLDMLHRSAVMPSDAVLLEKEAHQMGVAHCDGSNFDAPTLQMFVAPIPPSSSPPPPPPPMPMEAYETEAAPTPTTTTASPLPPVPAPPPPTLLRPPADPAQETGDAPVDAMQQEEELEEGQIVEDSPPAPASPPPPAAVQRDDDDSGVPQEAGESPPALEEPPPAKHKPSLRPRKVIVVVDDDSNTDDGQQNKQGECDRCRAARGPFVHVVLLLLLPGMPLNSVQPVAAPPATGSNNKKRSRLKRAKPSQERKDHLQRKEERRMQREALARNRKTKDRAKKRARRNAGVRMWISTEAAVDDDGSGGGGGGGDDDDDGEDDAFIVDADRYDSDDSCYAADDVDLGYDDGVLRRVDTGTSEQRSADGERRALQREAAATPEPEGKRQRRPEPAPAPARSDADARLRRLMEMAKEPQFQWIHYQEVRDRVFKDMAAKSQEMGVAVTLDDGDFNDTLTMLLALAEAMFVPHARSALHKRVEEECAGGTDPAKTSYVTTKRAATDRWNAQFEQMYERLLNLGCERAATLASYDEDTMMPFTRIIHVTEHLETYDWREVVVLDDGGGPYRCSFTGRVLEPGATAYLLKLWANDHRPDCQPAYVYIGSHPQCTHLYITQVLLYIAYRWQRKRFLARLKQWQEGACFGPTASGEDRLEAFLNNPKAREHVTAMMVEYAAIKCPCLYAMFHA